MKRKEDLLDAIEFYKVAIRVYKKKDLQRLAYFETPNNISIIEIYKSRLEQAEKELKELTK